MTALEATVPLEEARDALWDVVVVGAGPAGSLAARELARHSLSVLLVDRSSFPRKKLCGCCLNRASLSALEKVGLGDLAIRSGARPIRELRMIVKGRASLFPQATDLSLSREVFDTALAREAVGAGAEFLPQTHASLDPGTGPTRSLRLRQGEREGTVRTRIVVAADGLGGDLLRRETGSEIRIGKRSRIGAGVIVQTAPAYYSEGTAFMVSAQGGYMGLVRLEDNRLNIAAAFDPEEVKRSGGAGHLAQRLLREAGLPSIDGLAALNWSGKPALTRSRHSPAGHRLFLIGDTASYVEPFTGEGMAWALTSGIAVTPFVLRALREGPSEIPEEWSRRYSQLFGKRQTICRLITQMLRRPLLSRIVLDVFSFIPALPRALIKYVNAPIGQ